MTSKRHEHWANAGDLEARLETLRTWRRRGDRRWPGWILRSKMSFAIEPRVALASEEMWREVVAFADASEQLPRLVDCLGHVVLMSTVEMDRHRVLAAGLLAADQARVSREGVLVWEVGSAGDPAAGWGAHGGPQWCVHKPWSRDDRSRWAMDLCRDATQLIQTKGRRPKERIRREPGAQPAPRLSATGKPSITHLVSGMLFALVDYDVWVAWRARALGAFIAMVWLG